ncbi:hypothetical protein HPP92_019906 [Vanilla planifolia]|uniref:Pentatricopeptide repeat-containing protein n=1 Tax=Vanilla planifolia TaxID=51239 RepID=A0A835UJD0_VANPL|nr:hypothetical protein HPP92_019906 [Vanilla planifolia]
MLSVALKKPSLTSYLRYGDLHWERKPFCSSVLIDTLNTTLRPFPEYCPKKPSNHDAELVCTLTNAIKQRRSHLFHHALAPFAHRLRADHLIWSFPHLRCHPALALSFFRWFCRHNRFVPAEAQAIAAHLALSSGRVGAARQLLRQGLVSHRHFIEQVIYTYRYWSSDPSTFDLLFSVAVELGKLDDARSLFKRLTAFGVVISVDACNAFLSYLPVDEALNVFVEFPLCGVRWNVTSYNIVIRVLCGVGKVGMARDFLRNMDSVDGFPPDVISYSTVIDGYCQAGELQKAYELFEEMGKKGLKPNKFTVNSIMGLLCRNGLAVEAERLLVQMVNQGIVPDSSVYTTLMNGFSKIGDLSAVYRMVNEMKDRVSLLML